jgi:hypothetical protein
LLLEWELEASHLISQGLHYDIENGNLIKLDFLGHIQPDAVLCGRDVFPPEKTLKLYPNFFVKRKQYERMRTLHDLYCLPEACE